MGYGYKWKPSRAAAREFAETMRDIRLFCRENGIDMSASGDSYYFSVNGINYRVSNHSIEASNAGAYNAFGEMVRGKYHADARDPETVYIHAGKTRIREIYTDLLTGYTLDGRGNRKGGC